MADDRRFIRTQQENIMPSWAGLWDNVHAQPYALTGEPGATARAVARLMAPQGNRLFGSIATALTGAVPGGPVNVGYTQVQSRVADGATMGGVQPIATYTVVNRNTTATDELQIDQQLTPRFMPPVLQAGIECSGYPVDKSGNGGGGKLGTL
jgi:hypothetical protein